jgi:hypothetical protein
MLKLVLAYSKYNKLVFNLTLNCANNIILLFVFEVLSLRNIGDFLLKFGDFC